MPSLPTGVANGPAASAAATITIQNFAFGGPLTVAPGTSITVLNRDDVEHTVTADSAGGFDVTVPPGGSATFAAPNAPGTYAFHCSIHPHMKHGSLVVK